MHRCLVRQLFAGPATIYYFVRKIYLAIFFAHRVLVSLHECPLCPFQSFNTILTSSGKPTSSQLSLPHDILQCGPRNIFLHFENLYQILHSSTAHYSKHLVRSLYDLPSIFTVILVYTEPLSNSLFFL